MRLYECVTLGYNRLNLGEAMNFRILGSVLLIFVVLIFFLFYTEIGRLLVTAAGFGGLLR